MDKRMKRVNWILMSLALLCLVYYDMHRAIWLKGITSGWFVLIGFVNLVYNRKTGNRRFLILLETGLFLSAAADVILWNDFLLGAGVFALAHVFYFAAFCALDALRGNDWIPIATVAAVSLIAVFGTPFIQAEGFMTYVMFAYALIISCMLGKDIANLRNERSTARWLMLLGGGLFWFSDLMLAVSLFGDGGNLAGQLCVYTYWPGQIILAHSMFYSE